MRFPLSRKSSLEAMSRQRKVHLKLAGFSLVEVSLAMSVFTFALVALIGLFPVALQTSRHSLDLSMATQVADDLAAQLRMASRASLEPSQWDSPIYYDDIGNAATAQTAVYEARVNLRRSQAGDGDATPLLPSDSDSLTQAQISVLRRGGTPMRFSYVIFANR